MPKDKSTYFRHFRYNENCSLSVKSNFDYFNVNSIIKILKENYKERWVYAINSLIEHDHLHILEGKNWALNPLNYYINKFYDSLKEGTYFQLLILIISIDDEKVDGLFYKFLDSRNLNQDSKKYLLRKALNNMRPITRKTFEFITSEIELFFNI